MLKTPPDLVLRSLRRLSAGDADFQIFVEWLRAAREDAVVTMSQQRDAWSAAQHQGCVQTVDSLFAAIKKSRE